MASAIAIISAAEKFTYNQDESISLEGKLGFVQIKKGEVINFKTRENRARWVGNGFIEEAQKKAVKLLLSK